MSSAGDGWRAWSQETENLNHSHEAGLKEIVKEIAWRFFYDRQLVEFAQRLETVENTKPY